MIYSRVDLYRPSSSHLQKQTLYLWSGQRLTGFPKQALVFTCLQYKSFEITVGKGKIACHEQFLLFSQCFLPLGDLSAFFIQLKIVVCKLFQFGRV